MTRDDIPCITLGAPRNRSTTPPTTARQSLGGLAPQTQSLVTRLLVGTVRALDGAARAVASGARLAERLADVPAAATPPRATWTLRAAAGERVCRELLVTNERVSRLSGAVACTDWYSDTETRAAGDVVRFEPPVVDLGPGGMQPVQACLLIPRDLSAGSTYRATFFIAGSPDFRLPVELHISTNGQPARARQSRARPARTRRAR